MKDHTDYVLAFIERNHVKLSAKRMKDFRPLPLGTYTHRSLPYGPIRSGITDGVVAYCAVQVDFAVELHMTNLEFTPDKTDSLSPKKERKSSKFQPKIENYE